MRCREIRGTGGTCEVHISVCVHGDSFGVIVVAAAKIGGVFQDRVNAKSSCSIKCAEFKTHSVFCKYHITSCNFLASSANLLINIWLVQTHHRLVSDLSRLVASPEGSVLVLHLRPLRVHGQISLVVDFQAPDSFQTKLDARGIAAR